MPLRLCAGLTVPALLSLGALPQDRPDGQDARRSSVGPGYESTMVGAADSNGDGAVSSAEWQAFTRDLAPGGSVDRALLKARVVAALLDRDRDGRTTMVELVEGFASLDESGDGVIQPEERAAPASQRGGGGSGGTRFSGFRSRLAWGIVTAAADLDGDGAISEEERVALIDDAGSSGEDTASPEAMRAWILRVEVRAPSEDRADAPGSGDRPAVTPQAFLLAMDAGLDADKDGTPTSADLERLFAALDGDGDGVVTARERFAPPRPGDAPTDGSGSDAPRETETQQRSRPPLIAWQRNLEDALALSRRTGRPLLICVNMDGEPASESFAWQRYRDPAFAALTSGFVPLIVSPDRHTPIDHDDRGRRMPDPRFGRVVEGEHIDIEPLLFERYFKGNRVAPRHLAVAPDGTILFDLFLLQDVSQVDDALRTHGAASVPAAAGSDEWRVGEDEAEPDGSDDPPPLADPTGYSVSVGLNRPEAAELERVEAAFLAGDWRERFALASLALSSERSTQHPEVLRLSLRDSDRRVRRQGVWTAVREAGKLPADLQGEVLRASAEDPALRGALVGALGRLARTTSDEAQAWRAQRAWAAFSGLHSRSSAVDVSRWREELAGMESVADDAPSSAQIDPLLEAAIGFERAILAAPDDAGLRLEQALSLLQLSRAMLAARQDPSIALEEAGAAASAAETAGSSDPRAAAVRCVASWLSNDPAGAAAHGARALPGLVQLAGTPLALETLRIFAQARARAVYDALGEERGFEPAWVADVRDAHEVLLVHPGGGDRQAAEYLAFLGALDARAEQGDAARRGLLRFPLSGDLHAWLRSALLRDEGADALERVYSELPATPGGEASKLWYSGLATLMAAERQVGNRAPEAALAAYGRAVASFRASIEAQADYSDSALHYVSLALAGTARVHAEAQRWDEAVTALIEAVAARPSSAEMKDGLGHSPATTAAFVLRGLAEAQRADEARRLREALAAADVEPAAQVQSE